MSNYNDIDSGKINEIKKGLQSIGEAIETVAQRVVPDKELTDHSISGNKIHLSLCHRLNPSSLAASSNSLGMSLKAEDKSNIARGKDRAE